MASFCGERGDRNRLVRKHHCANLRAFTEAARRRRRCSKRTKALKLRNDKRQSRLNKVMLGHPYNSGGVRR